MPDCPSSVPCVPPVEAVDPLLSVPEPVLPLEVVEPLLPVVEPVPSLEVELPLPDD